MKYLIDWVGDAFQELIVEAPDDESALDIAKARIREIVAEGADTDFEVKVLDENEEDDA